MPLLKEECFLITSSVSRNLCGIIYLNAALNKLMLYKYEPKK